MDDWSQAHCEGCKENASNYWSSISCSLKQAFHLHVNVAKETTAFLCHNRTTVFYVRTVNLAVLLKLEISGL